MNGSNDNENYTFLSSTEKRSFRTRRSIVLTEGGRAHWRRIELHRETLRIASSHDPHCPSERVLFFSLSFTLVCCREKTSTVALTSWSRRLNDLGTRISSHVTSCLLKLIMWAQTGHLYTEKTLYFRSFGNKQSCTSVDIFTADSDGLSLPEFTTTPLHHSSCKNALGTTVPDTNQWPSEQWS